MSSKVSIIVPVYNSEKYIENCVNSILKQTYDNFEIILIDDGSKDCSYEIVKTMVNKYPNKIRGYSQSNQGVAITRNNGIKYAEGDFIMFIDNDDYIDQNYVETYVNKIVEEEADIVIGGYRRVDEFGKVLMERTLDSTDWSKYVQICPWAKIYSKSFIDENKLQFLNHPIGEDMYMNFIAFYKSKKTVTIEYVGYNWLYNPKSISSTVHRKIGGDSDPIPMMDKIVEKIGNDSNYDNGLYEFAYIKFIVWYLLYSVKGANKYEITEEYSRLFNWLSINFPKYKKNRNIGLFKPRGELFQIRFTVTVFFWLTKMRLAKIFLFIYSKI